jgi:hypothetical protein
MRVPFCAAKTMHRDHLHGALASLSIGVAESTGVDETLQACPHGYVTGQEWAGFHRRANSLVATARPGVPQGDAAQRHVHTGAPLITPQQSHTEFIALICPWFETTVGSVTNGWGT